MTKDDLRLAIRLALGELNIKFNSSRINGIVRHTLFHLENQSRILPVYDISQLDLFD